MLTSFVTLEQIVAVVAQFHARCWQHPALGTGFMAIRPWYSDSEHYQLHIERRRNEFAKFIAGVDERFTSELRSLYETALAGLPDLRDHYLAPRVSTHEPITLAHGDCYLL
jgi:hypothetical protein